MCVVDGTGAQILARETRSDESGLRQLVAAPGAHGVVRVGIERPDGVLVERILGAGLEMLAIHHNQAKDARPRYRMAGKSDGFDAYEIGEFERSWPGAAIVFSEVDPEIALALLDRYPGPDDPRGLGERRMAAFLARLRHSGRRPAAEIIARLRGATQVALGALEREARRGLVLGLMAALGPVVGQIAPVTSQIAHALDEHPDGQIPRSLFRDLESYVTAATLFAEIGNVRERYPDARGLAADADVAPVTIESGRQRAAGFRFACDKGLRVALAVLADTSRHHKLWTGDIYERARARGRDHPLAIHVLARAWTLVLWRIWQDRTTCDPACHGAHQRFLAAGG